MSKLHHRGFLKKSRASPRACVCLCVWNKSVAAVKDGWLSYWAERPLRAELTSADAPPVQTKVHAQICKSVLWQVAQCSRQVKASALNMGQTPGIILIHFQSWFKPLLEKPLIPFFLDFKGNAAKLFGLFCCQNIDIKVYLQWLFKVHIWMRI